MTAMDPEKCAALRAFVDFILSTEGQALAASYSFVGLAQSVIDYNVNTLNNVITWAPGTFPSLCTHSSHSPKNV
jgi:ABC-type Fe3+ transport system substrate-binding protein